MGDVGNIVLTKLFWCLQSSATRTETDAFGEVQVRLFP